MTTSKHILNKINETSPDGLSVAIDVLCLAVIVFGVLFGGAALQALQ